MRGGDAVKTTSLEDRAHIIASVLGLDGNHVRKIIDMVLEEAAKVADGYADASEKCGEPGPDDACSIAYAIRALKASP